MSRYDRNAWTKQIRQALADPPFARPAKPEKAKAGVKGKGEGRSALEETLALLLADEGILHRRQVRFCPNRKWTADFEIVTVNLTDGSFESFFVEVEGAVHRIKGRFKSDLEKYHVMTNRMGFRLVRVGRDQINNGDAIKWIREAMK